MPSPRSSTGISGGSNNSTAGGYDVGEYSSVSGGFGNLAMGEYSSVSGGAYNSTRSGYGGEGGYSSVSGGFGNLAMGEYSSVSGGYEREADGQWEWVAGALHQSQ